jgi:hypothetical protein
MNFTPVSFRLRATALPMPLLAPVIIATLSFSSMVSPLSWFNGVDRQIILDAWWCTGLGPRRAAHCQA